MSGTLKGSMSSPEGIASESLGNESLDGLVNNGVEVGKIDIN